MERNRRIGKAYARVPIVTIDGSHELSYDGYKLALNGFDNPDRDLKTEECRKRIGKGIRIKMDNFGNILIKRLSKSGVYIKEWIQAPASLPPTSGGGGGTNNQPASAATASSTATGGGAKSAKGAAASRVMPSRQQLIKNQNAAMMAHHHHLSSQSTNSSLGSTQSNSSCSMDAHQLMQPAGSNSSSGDSTTMTTNDSAICDEVLSVGGRLDQDKIYVLFDMKKFQANITQELCRAYPDKRKLEQQCFSIVGLTRDSDDILNLPCWVMVINIVAIEVLNERFPDLMCSSASVSSAQQRAHQLPYGGARQAPNFVSIFDNNSRSTSKQLSSKEEDPYSLPANESASSDMRSSHSASQHDYAATGGAGGAGARSRYYGGPSKHRAEMYKQRASDLQHHNQLLAGAIGGEPANSQMPRHKSRSNSNIYGVGAAGNRGNQPMRTREHQLAAAGRYNNSSSIYSPGHMLVLPSNDSVPPELPPRDFVSRKVTKAKSSTAIGGANQNLCNEDERIYSTGMGGQPDVDQISSINNNNNAKATRKTKRNRFLESLKAPLELAKSSSSRSSASVLGLSPQQANGHNSAEKLPASGGKKTAAGNPTSKGNIVKSFLGVKGSQNNNSSSSKQRKSNKQDAGGDEAKVLEKTSGEKARLGANNGGTDSGEADSVVDSAEELQDDPPSHHDQSCSSASSSYNDLDIPTPDYETDENIYALNEMSSSYAAFSSIAGGGGGGKGNSTDKAKKSSTTTRKDSAAASKSALGISQQQQQKNNGKQQNNGSKQAAHNKDDLYYSGFRAHVPSNININGGVQHQPQPAAAAAAASTQANGRSNGIGNGNGHGKAASLMDGADGMMKQQQQARTSRYASHLSSHSKTLANQHHHQQQQQPLASAAHKMSGRDMMIYGSTTGLSATGAASLSGAGARYRSASMQRYYSRSQMGGHQRAFHQQHQHQHQQPMYGDYYGDPMAAAAMEDPYGGGSHYGLGLQGRPRRRSNSKCLPVGPSSLYGHLGAAGGQHGGPTYDIGRSSSGIYGNNSNSSSSSDYADWHPQMRKVNSSGYLNSIFKNPHTHLAAAASNQPVESPYGSHSNHHSQKVASNVVSQQQQQKTKPTSALTHGNNASAADGFLGSRTLAHPSSRSASVLSKQQHSQLHSQQPVELSNGGPAYRSYDSSNDSEPSYTNSSDGLDIYDHIGATTAAAQTSRLTNNGNLHHNNSSNNHRNLHHRQFLDMQPIHSSVAHQHLTPEVHVGEWENMYDR